jgi:hypothetical protein
MSVSSIPSSPPYVSTFASRQEEAAAQPAGKDTSVATTAPSPSSASKAESASATSSRDTPVEDLFAHLQGLLDNTASPLAQSGQHAALLRASYAATPSPDSSFQEIV